MSEFDHLPEVDDEKVQAASIGKLVLFGLAYVVMWLILLLCVVCICVCVAMIFQGEMGGVFMLIISVLASMSAWRMLHSSRRMLQNNLGQPAHSRNECEPKQPAPNFGAVVMWAMLCALFLLGTFGLMAFVWLSIVEQRNIGFTVFLGSWSLLCMGLVVWSGKRCEQAYRQYDALQKRW